MKDLNDYSERWTSCAAMDMIDQFNYFEEKTKSGKGQFRRMK